MSRSSVGWATLLCRLPLCTTQGTGLVSVSIPFTWWIGHRESELRFSQEILQARFESGLYYFCLHPMGCISYMASNQLLGNVGFLCAQEEDIVLMSV